MEDDIKEAEPKPEIIDDPKILVSRYLSSSDFREDYERYNHAKPPDQNELSRFEGDNEKIEIYKIRRFLGESKDFLAETSLSNFMQTNNIHFRYNPKMYTPEARQAIEIYYEQWSDVVKKRKDIPSEHILRYDELQKNYHNDAAYMITKELSSNGTIPSLHVYYEDSEPVGMRNGIGREIVRRIRTHKAERGI